MFGKKLKKLTEKKTQPTNDQHCLSPQFHIHTCEFVSEH